ncbi:hypothetical protein M433DRAFT_143556 [Acidomyces richmondensis BFW]|nr:MAG: hypothetical protein FE78DRAFT_79510 [Acidomyces sp. 'richmondensis']KYG45842.1 hypothetical protein M433DRAFT_143556 [Acidomyces richmondensis BFW]
MARGRKPVLSQEQTEEISDEETQDTGNALRAKESLTWRAGKAIAVSDLLRRLKTLAEELQSIDQEDADRDTLVPKAQELANPQLLGHRDKGVKVWTMVCIVEMFRLLAPNAPYKAGQLKQIFDIFISMIILALASPSDPYNTQHLAVLISLASIKSIVLLTDIPNSELLMLRLFTNCFDVLSGNIKCSDGERLPKNVEYHITNMLCTLVDECPALPTGVVDIILAQFLRADPNALIQGQKKAETQLSSVMRELSPAYNTARSICTICGEKMSRGVGQYFSSVLIDASEAFSTEQPAKSRGRKRSRDESEDECDDDLLTPPAEHDLQEVEKAHRLLRELWRSSPEVIQNVVQQMEAEVAAENVHLRTMAVQTVGDMIAGIGAAGPPQPLQLDPAAYPPQSLDIVMAAARFENTLLTPAAPHALSSVYPSAYQGFIDRHRDKAASVRAAWAVAAGRIIATSGGGKGLDPDQESQLFRYLSDMLIDSDEKVRLAAVQAVSSFDFSTIVQKVGSNGGFNTPGSILSNMADRIKDRKHQVRASAMELLARIWGVAAGAIAEGSERIREMLGPIPTKIFMAVYINDREINALVQKVLHESLLPISYPPFKSRQTANGEYQRVRDSQTETVDDAADPDAIRAERILVLARDLEPKAKEVFFMLQQQQSARARYMEAYLVHCAKLNGIFPEGEEPDEKAAKKQFEKLVQALASLRPDSSSAMEHLHKFAKYNDRRSYQLIRFCYNPQSDYRKIFKAMKELVKRLEDASTGMAAVLDTLMPLVQSASILVYNRSHVPAIMSFARTDKKGLGNAAHEILTEISTKAPDVFKVHVRELCNGLQKQAPSRNSPNKSTAVDELKACAGFARRFPHDMPKDREFFKAMTAFAKYGSPPEAAKHAVTVIVAAADKREMYVKDVLKYCLTDFKYGADNFLSRLAALSQLRLVANKETEEEEEAIMDVAVTKVLKSVAAPVEGSDSEWKEDVDDQLCAKLWALKILVNGLRGAQVSDDISEVREELNDVANRVYRLLNTLIDRDGELASDGSTPGSHKAHLRLAAANQLLKLSCNKATDQFLTPRDFNNLARICQDPLPAVRAGFVKTLKKYLGQGKLPTRFYSLVFMYAFEPSKPTKESVTTWLQSRAALCAKQQDTVLQTVFARFLSLLAHHPDFSPNSEDLEDFVEYIVFYLKTVATQDNLSIIYHMAQRVKSVQDGIDPEQSDRLYILSDLAEAVIRCFQDIRGWSLQLYGGIKARLPTGIFSALPNHAVAQQIAEKRYIPDDLADRLEDLVKASMRPKKRKGDASTTPAIKKIKTTPMDGEKKQFAIRKAPQVPKSSRPIKTPKRKAVADANQPSERRKSTRISAAKNYAEYSDEEDDDAMKKVQYEDSDADKENVTSSTPPTSDPMPIAPLAKEQARVKEKGKAKAAAASANEEKELSDPPSDMEV